jgi:hypothetical protein
VLDTHFKGWDARHNSAARLIRSEIGPFGHAFLRVQKMAGIVAKALSWGDARGFPDDSVSFEDENLARAVSDNPFPTADGHREVAVVVNRDKINEAMGAVGRCLVLEAVDQSVQVDPEVRKLNEFRFGAHGSTLNAVKASAKAFLHGLA